MKRGRNQKDRESQFPLVVVVFGGVLVFAAAILFALRGGGDGGGTPALIVDRDVIDYGDVKLNTELSFSIKVTNSGDGDLKFSEAPYIEVVEGC
jgi:hypothetical protein